MGLFDRFKAALSKTRDKVVGGLRSVLPFGKRIDDQVLTELEETMLRGDMGPSVTSKLIEAVRGAWKAGQVKETQEIIPFLKQTVAGYFPAQSRELRRAERGPTVVLVAGVNGSGKTTSVAKLTHFLTKRGSKVILGACDTFRAAAVEQLSIWAQRAGVEVIRHGQGADPAAVAFAACEAAQARGADLVLIDTAGRLHTQDHLMRELNKIERVVAKKIPGAPHEVLLVLDATIGQNAISQAKQFGQHVQITGIILAKLDGSAKGGIVVSIREQLNVPVKFVGLGEGMDDLEAFDPETFVEALFAE